MTLASTLPIIDYIEDGATLIHAIPFQFNDATEIRCTRIPAGGVEGAVLTLGADYNVTGGSGGSGTVVKTNAGTNGTTFRIRRASQESQQTKFSSTSSFPAGNVEKALDHEMAVAQEIDVARSLLEQRSLRVLGGESIPELPAPAQRASMLMQWSGDGKTLLMTGVSALAALLAAPLALISGAATKGDPGANVMSIGLFAFAAALSIPNGTDVVRTSGYSLKGIGIADYVNDDATVNGAYVAANPRTSFISANGRGFRLVSAGKPFNVKWFGAMGDSDINAATGTDDTAALQAAIDYINARGGGTAYFPEGYYKVSSYLTLCKKLHVLGAGRTASMLVTSMIGGGGATNGQSLRNGTIFYSNWPSNASTGAEISIEHIGFQCSNAANIGAAFYDNGGSYIRLRQVYVKNFKYGVVLDQTEVSGITESELTPANSGGACVWLVNGASLTPGNSGGYTNAIDIMTSQLNAGATVNLIQDDGGADHSFGPGNNYNGGNYQLRLAGVNPFQVFGGEFEGGTSNIVLLTYLASDGAGAGSCTGSFYGGIFSGAVDPNVNIVSAGVISFYGCLFSAIAAYPVKPAGNAARLEFHGCYTGRADAALTDSANTQVFDSRIERGIRTNSGLAAYALDASYARSQIQCTNAVPSVATIPNDATLGLPIGATFLFEQTTAFAQSVVAGAGVTLTGVTATGGQYQLLKMVKIAANAWRGYRATGIGSNAGWTADTGTAEKGAHATYTSPVISNPPTQAEVQAIADALQSVSRGQKAIKDALMGLGELTA